MFHPFFTCWYIWYAIRDQCQGLTLAGNSSKFSDLYFSMDMLMEEIPNNLYDLQSCKDMLMVFQRMVDYHLWLSLISRKFILIFSISTGARRIPSLHEQHVMVTSWLTNLSGPPESLPVSPFCVLKTNVGWWNFRHFFVKVDYDYNIQKTWYSWKLDVDGANQKMIWMIFCRNSYLKIKAYSYSMVWFTYVFRNNFCTPDPLWGSGIQVCSK